MENVLNENLEFLNSMAGFPSSVFPAWEEIML